MKIQYNIIHGFWVVMCLFLVWSCDEDSNWTPGPEVNPDNPGVVFDANIPAVIEVEANQQGQLLSDYFTVPLLRDEGGSLPALEVPVIVHHASDNLIVSDKVVFEEGAATAFLEISVSEFEIGVPYDLSLEIDGRFTNPYLSYDENEKGGSSRIDAKVEVVSILGVATFTASDQSGSNPAVYYPFEHKIYDNQDGTFVIKNFLFNNMGYDFEFSVDDEMNIRPSESNGYHSVDDGRWYFYSENSSSSSYRIPCYFPGPNPDDYITYIYFYLAESTSSYQDFWLDLENKTGRMMGYSRYSVSSSGRVAFDITWE